MTLDLTVSAQNSKLADIEIHSTQPVEVSVCPKLVKVILQSEWHEERSGGSHLYQNRFNKTQVESWSKNPKF